MKNRVNEIKWTDWHVITDNMFILKDIPVVGVTFNNKDGVNRQNILSKLKRWEAVDVTRDANNEKDANAIAVVSGMGKIGHLSSELGNKLAPLLKLNNIIYSKISRLYGGKEGKNYGAKLEIRIKLQEGCFNFFDVKVVSVRGINYYDNDRKDVADNLKIGDILDLCTDDFDDRVTVDTLDGDIGRLNAKNGRLIAPLLYSGYKYIAVVSDKFNSEICLSVCLWKI